MYPILRWAAISGSGIATSICIALKAMAQSTLPPGVTIPPTAPEAVEQTIPQPEQSPRLPSKTPTLQPKLELQTPSIQESPEVTPPSSDRFLIKQVQVQGNTILDDEIADLTQPYQNREATLEDLLQLRSAIAQLYIKNGYTTSAAFLLNNQDLSTGIVQIQVVEGELEQMDIGGLRRLRAGYVRSRLKRATSTPLNQQRPEEALQLLHSIRLSGCVAKRERDSKVGKLHCYRSASHVYSLLI